MGVGRWLPGDSHSEREPTNDENFSTYIVETFRQGWGTASGFFFSEQILRAFIRECLEETHFRYSDSRFRFILEKSFEKQIEFLGFDKKPTNK